MCTSISCAAPGNLINRHKGQQCIECELSKNPIRPAVVDIIATVGTGASFNKRRYRKSSGKNSFEHPYLSKYFTNSRRRFNPRVNENQEEAMGSAGKPKLRVDLYRMNFWKMAWNKWSCCQRGDVALKPSHNRSPMSSQTGWKSMKRLLKY
ncbi:uncharacterized protein [Bemisia tabaci]|uniref:uncharacterized protein isoform X1 n=1 Tax=Bemisia tabaci TaxID=7038 RepID=UPI003B283AB8